MTLKEFVFSITDNMRQSSPIPIMSVVLIGIAISFLLFWKVSNDEKTLEAADFEREAETISAAIVERVENHIDVLKALNGLYVASIQVEREEFHDFVEVVGKRYSGIQALEWIPIVYAEEREAIEQQAQINAFPTFEITERTPEGNIVRAEERSQYFPVYFVEPYLGNENALGFDLGSNQVRLEALNLASESGDTIATARITLVQETGDQYGFLMFIPVYEKEKSVAPPLERYANLKGFVLSVFRIGDMVTSVINDIHIEDLDIYMHDLTEPLGEQLLYQSPDSPDRPPESEIVLKRGHIVGGREWEISIYPNTSSLIAANSWQTWGVLFVGLLFTGIMALYMYRGQQETIKIEKIVVLRTKELDDYAQVVSHDLRAPLRALNSYAQFLLEDFDAEIDDDGKEYLQGIQDSAKQMNALISDLLKYAQIGRTNIELSRVNLRDIIEKASSNLELTDHLHIPNDMPVIQGYAVPLEQIFQNLLSNAAKFVQPGQSPEITIAWAAHGRYYEFTVSDNGIGIQEKNLAKIFDVFHRLHTQEEFEGTGIGLAIAKKAVEKHGGKIKVSSKRGQGSIFTFTIPKTIANE